MVIAAARIRAALCDVPQCSDLPKPNKAQGRKGGNSKGSKTFTLAVEALKAIAQAMQLIAYTV